MSNHASTVRAMAQWLSKMDDHSATLAFHHFLGALEVQIGENWPPEITPQRICDALRSAIQAHSSIAPPLAEPGTPEGDRIRAFYESGTYTGD